jgi:hypothetical protein
MHLRSALILCLTFVFAACGGGAASEIGLRLDDFPSGWTQHETESDDSSCESIVAAKKTTTDYDRSPQFERRPGSVATSYVYLYASEAEARDAFAKLTSDTTSSCLADVLGSPRLTGLDVAAVGDERAGLRAAVAMTKKQPAAVFDLVFVRSGAGIAEVVVAGVFKPVDPQLREDLTAKVTARLAEPRP